MSINTNIFKTIEDVFQLFEKETIDQYFTDNIDKLVDFLISKGYSVNSTNGFTNNNDVWKNDSFVDFKLQLVRLIIIRNGISGNWNYNTGKSDKLANQFWERIQATFDKIYINAD